MYLKKLWLKNSFPNLKKDSRHQVPGIQIQESQRVPNKLNPNRQTPKHIIIKLVKFKDTEKILNLARQK